MGNHPTVQYNGNTRPVVRVPAQPRLEDVPQPLPGYKQRQAPRPPQRVPSYKNPHCLVLPREAPNGILKHRNGSPPLPAEDYFSDEHDAESELDSPDEDFSERSGYSKNGVRPNSALYDQRRPLAKGNYTPNGEVIHKDRRSKSLPLEESPKPLGVNGNVPNGLHKLPNGNYQRQFVPNGRAMSGQGMSETRNGLERIPERSSEARVTFAKDTSQKPELGSVVRPMRRQKGRAPPPPRPPPPNVAAAPPAPFPPAVVSVPDPAPVNPTPPKPRQPVVHRPSLHEQLQEDIIKAAVARQSRDPVPPPKIEKPKTGEEEFRENLIKVCKRIETYPGDETDGDAYATGRDSEWETTYDPNDYKPKTTSKFLVKSSTNLTRSQPRQQANSAQQKPAAAAKPVQSKKPVQSTEKPQPSTEGPVQSKSERTRAQSVDSALGGTINLIQTRPPQDDWTPDQDLKDDMDIEHDPQPAPQGRDQDPRNSAVFGPSMRMNMQESSMGSVRMYRSRSTDQGRPDKPTRYHGRHRNSDGSVRSKSSIQSFKDSIRSAFSSVGTSAKTKKERTSVRGYFEQGDYRYGPNVRPVMFYHAQDPHAPYYHQNYYPMPYRHPQAMSPTVPYGPWYEDPYRMYGQPPVPMMQQPVLITDGTHRRTIGMDEMQYGPQAFGPVLMEPRSDSRGRSRRREDKPRSASQNREYSGSWSSLKDDIQYDQGSISRSWRRLKGRARGRTKSRESLDDWEAENGPDQLEYSSDEEDNVTQPLARENSRQEASRRYQEVMQRGSRRRAHGKKNGGVSSSSDENRPPTKLLREESLPPSGQKRNRYRKRGSADLEL